MEMEGEEGREEMRRRGGEEEGRREELKTAKQIPDPPSRLEGWEPKMAQPNKEAVLCGNILKDTCLPG